METITSADGTPIAYERTGDGPPLVLVHGATADHARWEPVLPAFEEHYTAYAIDRRGRGESGDSGEYALEREAEDVAAMVGAIDGPVNLLGHSYGAICSLEAALLIDGLGSLVLYEPPIPVGDDEPDTEGALAEITALHEDGDDEEALVSFLRDVAGMPPVEIDALRSAPNWPARVGAVHTVIREERARRAYRFEPARLESMTTPTLLLAGGASAQLYRVAIDALDEALPNSRIAVLEGQGHAAMNTAPDRFVEAVLGFLRETG